MFFPQIIKRANELGEDPVALSGRFCQEFLNDMIDLQCLMPTHQPRVTDHMDQIKEMIAQVTYFSYAFFIFYFYSFSLLNCFCGLLKLMGSLWKLL